MARKKKKGMKGGKHVQAEKRRNIILFKSASEPVQVPDVLYHLKKRSRLVGGQFVASDSVQDVVSLPLVSGGFVKRKSEVVISKKKKGKIGVTEFVPSSCITDSTTPVVHFKVKLPTTKVNNKKKRFNYASEFVSSGCITQHISLPYIKVEKDAKQENINLDQHHDQGMRGKTKYRRRRSSIFVPPCCITDSPAKVYHFPTAKKTMRFYNPFPDSLTLTPDIVYNCKTARKFKKQQPFIPASCMTSQLSRPFQQAKVRPAIKFIYVERPNTPDILGPSVKIKKRKTSKVIPFVPKSCMVEQKQFFSNPVQKTEALAKAESQTLREKKSLSNILPIIALLAFIAMVVGYVLQK